MISVLLQSSSMTAQLLIWMPLLIRFLLKPVRPSNTLRQPLHLPVLTAMQLMFLPRPLVVRVCIMSMHQAHPTLLPLTRPTTVYGLDPDVTYTLTETATEDGYNLLDGTTSITPTVVVNGTANATKVTVAEATGVSAGNDSAEAANTMQLSAKQVTKIENNQGSVLPSTGGIGTTIFYVIGAILVLGAGILLVTRRRMNAN